MSDEHAPELLQNEGRWDRILRAAIGFGLLILGLSGLVAAPYDAWLRVATIFPFATALLGWCPLYQALGIETHRRPRRRDGFAATRIHALRSHLR